MNTFFAENEPNNLNDARNSYHYTLNQSSLDYNYNLSNQTRGNSIFKISDLINSTLILKNQTSNFILGNDLRLYDKTFYSESSSSSSKDINNQYYDNSYEPKISNLSYSNSDFSYDNSSSKQEIPLEKNNLSNSNNLV